MDIGKDNRARWLICLALALITAAVYWQVVRLDFTNYDDPDYVTRNAHVTRGLTWDGVVWAFTQSHASNWHPVTWLSHMLDCDLFGMNAGAHHTVNALIHITNSVLLFWILSSLTGARWRSAVVAGLFALHPLHVESVAWISERKDVLSTLFALLAIQAYGRFVWKSEVRGRMPEVGDRRSEVGGQTSGIRLPTSGLRPLTSGDYWLALFFFTLGLMSKPMLVTLPFVLLLLDWWPLQRIPALRLVLEKWPWFVLAAISSVVTLYAQKRGGSVIPMELFSFHARLANSLMSYLRYVGKMFWPIDLAVIYPCPPFWPAWQAAGAGLFVVVVSILLIRRARQRPFLLTGWLWYLGTLVPVIGVVQVGTQSMADRYTYVPLIGLFILIVWGAADLMAGWRRQRMLAAILATFALTLCALVSAGQLRYWKNNITLFEHALAVTTDNAVAQNNLGSALAEAGRKKEARLRYAEAVRLKPGDPVFENNFAVVLAADGETNAAAAHLDIAIAHYLSEVRTRPDRADAYNHLGVAMAALGRRREAVAYYQDAVRLAPEDPVYQNNLGVALAKEGDATGAIARHRDAIRLKPDFAEAYNNLGVALVSQGHWDEAIPHFDRALSLNPRFAEAQNNLGGALARQGKDDEAIAHYRQALQLDPDSAKIRFNLGFSLARLGRMDEAISCFTEAIRLDPDALDARYNLGRCLVQQGRFEPGIAQLEEVVKRAPDHAAARFFLGRAWIGLRRPDLGIGQLREALRLRPDGLDVMSSLAWVLATDENAQYRDGAEAIRLAEKAAVLTEHRQPAVLDALAAAYAEAGRFDDAVAAAQKAIELARANRQTNLALQVETRLRLYQNHRPFRASSMRK